MNRRYRAHFSRFSCYTALTVFLFTSGCSVTSDDSVENPPFTVENVESTWLENRRMWQEIEAASGRLETYCAIESGLDEERIPPPPNPDLDRVQSEEAMGRLQPRINSETAEKIGYAELVPGMFESEDQDEEDDSSESFTVERDVAEVLYGSDYADETWDSDYEIPDPPGKITIEIPEGDFEASWFTDGCVGEVTDYLHQGDPASFLYTQTIATASMNNFARDHDEHTSAQADWVDCMYDEGYEDFTAFGDEMMVLFNLRDIPADVDPANPEQIELAVADATCTEEHQVNERHKALFDELLMDYFEDNELELYSYNESAQIVLARAQEAIQQGGI